MTCEHLSRRETIARPRAHAANEIRIAVTWLRSNDPPLLNAVWLHFRTLAAARRAARVVDPP